tara:strand:+ start:824 stop:1267 length:444 start_codon:yes stop_codon:yes gene_type:complete
VFISEYILKADEAEKALHVGSKNRKNVKINHVNEDKPMQTKYEPFDGSQIKDVMKFKQRSGIYDLKSEDFNRLVTLNKSNKKSLVNSSSERELDEVDEFFEEIGDIDPKQILNINQDFEQDMLNAEADIYWCLSKLIDDIQDNYTEL